MRCSTSHPPWSLGSGLEGAGGLLSSADDLLTYLAATIGLVSTPLAGALSATRVPELPFSSTGRSTGLAWGLVERPGKSLVVQAGGAAGYRSFIGYDPNRRVGVVVLSNANLAGGCEDIGMRSPTSNPCVHPRTRSSS
jgi:D-alanyl-D-alanine-carboxypeptidase/D-alanyl-D-alanine-endopeptidase